MLKLSVQRLFENLMSARKHRLNPQSRSAVVEYALVLLGLGGLFYFLFGSTFQSQFDLTDDFLILNILSQRTSLWDLITNDIQRWGRFRPVYWVTYLAQTATFGANSHIWHIAATSLGVLTCFLIYITVRKIRSDIPSSMVFILLLAVSGTQNVIWYRLSPAETQGMFLTAVALWAIVNAAYQCQSRTWDGLALTAMALAGLTKESFVLIIPALLLLRWMLHCWVNQSPWIQTLRTLRARLITGSLIFIAEISIVTAVLVLKPEAYGPTRVGISLNSFNPVGWYTLAASSGLAALAFSLPPFIALILAVYWFGKKLRPYILVGSLICVAWVIPQLVLYKQRISSHYLFPAVVGIAAVILCGLMLLWRRRIWFIWIACVVWLLPVLSSGLSTSTRAASANTATTLVVHKMVTYLAENIVPDQSIVIMADPALNTYPVHSLHTHLKFYGLKSPVYLLPILPKQGYANEWLQRRAKDMTAMFPDLNTLDPEHIGSVIVVTPPDDFFNIPWLVTSPWQRKTFSEPYSSYSLSLQKLGYQQENYISYDILTAGGSPLISPLTFPPDYPLVTIDASLKGKLGIILVKTARWRIENQNGGRLWLGHGEEEGLGISLWAAQKQAIQAIFQVKPGPARPDSQRTIELTVQNQAGTQNARRQFDQATELTVSGELQPGWNDVRIAVLDEATIFKQPNGDVRPVLVLLRHITVGPLSTK
jgi:hypothetical protein